MLIQRKRRIHHVQTLREVPQAKLDAPLRGRNIEVPIQELVDGSMGFTTGGGIEAG